MKFPPGGNGLDVSSSISNRDRREGSISTNHALTRCRALDARIGQGYASFKLKLSLVDDHGVGRATQSIRVSRNQGSIVNLSVGPPGVREIISELDNFNRPTPDLTSVSVPVT